MLHSLFRQGLCALLALALALPGSLPAEAKAKKGFSAIAVDAYTGKVLVARDADVPRYPASITKVMTLYIVFQEMRAGRLRKGTPLKVSANAANQPPSRLGLKRGDKVSVDDAIKALVTRSANDVAMVVAENISGSAEAFAKRMTRTARELGMTRTQYRNPSGLPNPAQVTTARDIATLSLRIQRDFPEYYGYFRIPSFVYKGKTIGTHNKLIGHYDGVDGIKTGYIAAAGFNLTTSVKRGDKRLVGVVLGAPSGGARNRYMMAMLDPLFAKVPASPKARVAALAGSPPGFNGKITEVAAAKPSADAPDSDGLAAKAMEAIASVIPGEAKPKPRPKPVIITAATVEPDTPAEAPAAPVASPEDAAELDDEDGATLTTFTAVVVQEPGNEVAAMMSPEAANAPREAQDETVTDEKVWPVSTREKTQDFRVFATGSASPAAAAPEKDVSQLAAEASEASEETVSPKPAQVASAAGPAAMTDASPEPAAETPVAPKAPAGWQIQIGAWKAETDAQKRLDRVTALKLAPLSGKSGLTFKDEQKGVVVYTARFAGFGNEREARLACRALSKKRVGCVPLPPQG